MYHEAVNSMRDDSPYKISTGGTSRINMSRNEDEDEELQMLSVLRLTKRNEGKHSQIQ